MLKDIVTLRVLNIVNFYDRLTFVSDNSTAIMHGRAQEEVALPFLVGLPQLRFMFFGSTSHCNFTAEVGDLVDEDHNTDHRVFFCLGSMTCPGQPTRACAYRIDFEDLNVGVNSGLVSLPFCHRSAYGDDL
jgi:hypothetical protein